MVSGARVLLFLLAVLATCSFVRPNIDSNDGSLGEIENKDLENLSEEEDNINEEKASINDDEEQELENKEEFSEETDTLEGEDPDDDDDDDDDDDNEKNREDFRSHLENEETNEKSPSAKTLSDLGISESDLQQIVTEAEEEVKRENPKVPEDSSHSFSRLTYQAKHYRAKYDPETEKRTHQALTMERVMEKLTKRFGLTNDEVDATLAGLKVRNLVNFKIRLSCKLRQTNWFARRFRTLDGTCNNLKHPQWGAVNTPFKRVLRPDYADGRSKPRESNNKKFPLPNPRTLSFNVFRDRNNPSRVFTHMTMIWGQFIDHDLTLAAPQMVNCPTAQQKCTKGPNRGECFGVPVPPNDPHFVDEGVKCLHLVRNAPAVKAKSRRREQSNTLTSFIDASQVYDVNKEALDSLRIPGTSFLKTQKNPKSRRSRLLPRENPEDGFCRSSCGKDCFLAGDERVNENQGLASMHTLFVREHNRIARVLTFQNRKRRSKWSRERIFEETRKIIGAQIQHITYNEFLPIILNGKTRNRFGLNLLRKGFFFGYNNKINPSIINSFATAAYRFGHSMVQNSFSRPGKSAIPTKSFFDPCPVFEGTSSIFQGLFTDKGQSVDGFFATALTQDLVIGPNILIDLPAINIQRGRDHGLPGYNKFRKRCGLRKATTFAGFRRQISPANIAKLKRFYKNVNDVDLFAGGILENPLRGAVLGPTFSCLVGQQFRNLRRGDRFWYENRNRITGFTPAQLSQIRRVTLARLICDNNRLGRAGEIRKRVMRVNSIQVRCDQLPRMDLGKW